MAREHFFGFYPTPPVWIGDKPTPEALGKARSGNLWKFMASIEATEKKGDLQVDVARDGLFMLSAKHLADKVIAWSSAEKQPPPEEKVAVWSEALEYLNCLNLLFQSAFVRVMQVDRVHLSEVTMYNAFTLTLEDGKFAKGGGWALGYSAHVFAGRFPNKYGTGMTIAADERIGMRLPVSLETVKACFGDFFLVVEKKLVSETAVICRALSQYKAANYSNALVLLWFLIEEFIAEQWKSFLAKQDVEIEGEKRMWSDRRKFLTGRDFGVSTVSNALELVSALDFKLFRMIDRVRGYRNAIVHNKEDFDARAVHCQEAFKIAQDILVRRGGPKIDLSLTSPVPSVG